MIKYLTSTKTAHGDTTKTLIDTLTLPTNTKTIIGAWGYAIGGAGITTVENVTGILELESDDVNIQPCIIPLDPIVVLTSGVGAFTPKVWPMNVPISGSVRVKGYVTMDLAQTVANTCRFGLVLDVG